MTNQSDRQADARSSTSTALTYEGDSLAYFDSQSVPAGDYNGRLLAWINQALGTSYTEINGAKTALANNISIPTWDGLNLLGKAGTPAAPFLPKWNAALALRTAGTRNAKLLFIGDSTTAGWGGQGTVSHANDLRWSVPRRILPWLPYGSDTSFFGDHNTLVGAIALGTFDSRIVLGSWGQNQTFPKTLGGPILTCTAGTTPLTFTTQYAVDTFDIYTRGDATLGSFTAQIDAGGLTTIDQSLSPGTVVKTTVTAALGTHVLKLARVAGNVDVLGVIGYNSAQKETTVINAGWSGSVAADWQTTAGAYDPLLMLPIIAPDLTIINLTINDWVAATNTTAYTNSMQAIITAAAATGDVILMTGVPTDTATTGAAQQLTYINICQSLATTNNIPFINMTTQWTSWANANANGWMFDAKHPNGTGYALIPSIIASTMRLSQFITTEAQAIINNAVTPLSATDQRTISFTTQMLKSTTCWADLDKLHAVSADAQTSSTNWKAPGTKDLIQVASPAFVAYRGFTGNGTSSYNRTQFVPSTDGVNYTLTSASLWWWSLSSGQNAVDAGNNTTAPLTLVAGRTNTNIATIRINDATATTVASSDGSGFFGAQRSGSTKRIIKAGVSQTSASVAATGLPTVELWLGASNSTIFGTNQEAVFAVGASLLNKELAFYNCMLFYMQEVGAWPIT